MADGYITLPALQTQATTDKIETCDGDVSLPSFTASANVGANGAITLPSFTNYAESTQILSAQVSGYLHSFNAFGTTLHYAEIQLPNLSVSGYTLVEKKISGTVELPALRGNVNDEFHDIPRGIVGLTAHYSDINLPFPKARGYTIVSPVASGYIELKTRANGYAVTGIVGSFDKKLPKYKVDAVCKIVANRIANGEINLSNLEVVSYTDDTIILDLSEILLAINVSGTSTIDSGDFHLLTWRGD